MRIGIEFLDPSFYMCTLTTHTFPSLKILTCTLREQYLSHYSSDSAGKHVRHRPLHF